MSATFSVSTSSTTQAPITLPNPSLALQVIPSRTRTHDVDTLKATMHSMVLDTQHPIALELAGTAESRCLLVRATSSSALKHVAEQLRAHEPQTGIASLDLRDDPFQRASHERISALELLPGAPSYLPLQSWEEEKGERPGTDPMLGLLGALANLPEGTRAIAQIALVPAKPTWSHPNQRKGIEHALEPERERKQRDLAATRAAGGTDTPSTATVVGLGLLVGLFFLYRRFQNALPPWVTQAVRDLIHGHIPHLTGKQQLLFWAGIGAVFLGCVVLFILCDLVRRLFSTKTPVYDMNLVSRKTLHMAYRTRVRLYVISPAPARGARVPSRFPWCWRVGWTALFHQSPTATYAQIAEDAATMWTSLRGQPVTVSFTQVAADFRDFCRVSWANRDAERTNEQGRQDILSGLVAAYRQFNLAGGAYFVPSRVRTRRAEELVERGWDRGLRRSSHFLDLDALTNMWHLPHPAVLVDLALVEHRRARTILIPPRLLATGRGKRTVGYSEHAGYRRPVSWPDIFLRQHTQITGKSGEGKSTCMEQIALEIMLRGEGLVFLTPHGDTIRHLLSLVPRDRQDVVLIDLSDPDFSIGLNPLDVGLGRSYSKAVSDMLKTIAKIWVTSFGPRMEIAAESAMKTLAAHNRFLCDQDRQRGPHLQHTLLDVLTVLTSESFCHALLQDIDDPFIHRWWRQYYEPLSLYMQRERIDPVLTKMAKFESEVARRILGQSRSTINFSQLISDRSILLINLGKGAIGDDAAKLLGATFLSLIQICMEEQGVLDEDARAKLAICVDEYQFLAGVDYQALAELRKFGATFFLGTQSLEYMEQLDPMLLPTIRNNVRQFITFHTSAQDARMLSKELEVPEEDILGLEQHMCYVKLREHPAFSMTIEPALADDQSHVPAILANSRRYCRPAGAIEQDLKDALARSIAVSPRSGRPAGKTVPSVVVSTASPTTPAQQMANAPLPQASQADGASPVLVAPAKHEGADAAQGGKPHHYRGRLSEAQRRQAENEHQRGSISPMGFSDADMTAMAIKSFTQGKDENDGDA